MRKTAYEMRISDWSSDVCSSDLRIPGFGDRGAHGAQVRADQRYQQAHQPRDQQRQRDRGHPLPPEMTGAGLARADVARLLERRAERVFMQGHASIPMATNQSAAEIGRAHV